MLASKPFRIPRLFALAAVVISTSIYVSVAAVTPLDLLVVAIGTSASLWLLPDAWLPFSERWLLGFRLSMSVGIGAIGPILWTWMT
jgi:hypothetical protein